jgi:hypothetical protein
MLVPIRFIEIGGKHQYPSFRHPNRDPARDTATDAMGLLLLVNVPILSRCDEGIRIDDGPEAGRSEQRQWPIKAADESCNSESQHKDTVGDQVSVERPERAYHGGLRRRPRAFSWHAVDETGRSGPLSHAAQR